MQALHEWSSGSWIRKAASVFIEAAACLAAIFAAMLAYTLIFKAPSLAEIVGRVWYMTVPAALVTSLMFLETMPAKKPGRLAAGLSWAAVAALAVCAALLAARDGCTAQQKALWIAACLVSVLIYVLLDKLIEILFKR